MRTKRDEAAVGPNAAGRSYKGVASTPTFHHGKKSSTVTKERF